MKTRIVVIAILLLILTVLLTRNDERIANALLALINPIKQNYKNFTHNIEDKSQSYIFQKEAVEKLSLENRILRKRLLEQMHYIKQVKDIYDVLPKIQRLPLHSVSITETISYVKLNSFSQIILTKPNDLTDNKLYGLIQQDVVAGIAQVKNNQLYGYLTSDKKCRFAVFIGESKATGIAEGLEQNEMIVKFIPKWHNVQPGDKVVTSGLDAIFFENIPVGIVTRTELLSSYKVAYIKTYSDIFHPKTFFLINDAKMTLTDNFDANATRLENARFSIPQNIESNGSKTSTQQANTGMKIPKGIDQTPEETIEPETPAEDKDTKANNETPEYLPKKNGDQLDLF